jgi:RecB family exonuclease
VLSVTEIARLLRDPYAVYAGRVLGLKPLPPLRAEPDARLDGIAVHRVMEDFARAFADDAAAAGRLADIAADRLARDVPWPAARAFLQARIARVADLLADPALTGGLPVAVERDGAVLVGETGVTLRGRPDRIDRLADGRLHLIDYKTGKAPSPRDRAEVDRQLLLLAAMAQQGAFGPAPPGIAGASYVSLAGGGEVVPLDTGPEALAEVWDWLEQQLDRMRDPATGFTARRSGAAAPGSQDYAQLSRHGEWLASDRPQGEDME